MGDPTSIMGIAQMAMGGAGGGKGGGGGGSSSGEGLTPQEAALIQYNMHQKQLAEASQFANAGTGHSTMATQAWGGPRIAAALEAAQISGANRDVTGQGLQNLAQQQGTAAGQLASNQGGDQGLSGSQDQTTGVTDQTG